MSVDRCRGLAAMVLLSLSLGLGGCGQSSTASPAGPIIQVYKTATCQCCAKWAAHLRDAGFTVETHNAPSLSSVKSKAGVPRSLWTCHTALVDGYVIEGHVPAPDIQRLLTERPSGSGLAVPGMPIGSPGMEQGGRHDSYDVLLFDEDGGAKVYASH